MPIKERLYGLKYACVSLATECAEDYAVDACTFGLLNLLCPNHSHLLSLVDLMRQLLLERVVLEETEVRVTNHTRLYVESSISDEYHTPSSFYLPTGLVLALT